MTMHSRPVCISNPPKVKPVGVQLRPLAQYPKRSISTNLMICYQNHPIRKMALHSPICCFPQLPGDGSITAYSHNSRSPPLRQGGNEDTEGLLGESHVSIVEVFIIPVQWYPKELSQDNPMRLASSLERADGDLRKARG
jgi:hypothetical protein